MGAGAQPETVNLLASAGIIACLLASEIAAQPTPVTSAYDLGKLYLDKKDYSNAEQQLARAEAQSPGKTDALALRAKALIQLGRFAQAEQSIRGYRFTHPESPDAAFLMAYILFRENNAKQSLAMYTEAAKLQRPTAEDFKIVGLDYVLLNDNADAVKWLERAAAEDSTSSEAAYYLGRAYFVQNSFDRAIAEFQRALKLNPDFIKAEDNLGLAYAGKNQPVLAEAAYRRAIAMGDKEGKPYQDAYLNLAELFSHEDRDADALALLKQADQIGGQPDRTKRVRASIFLARDRLDDAETELRSALQSKPDDGSLHYLLGRVLKREGKDAEAEQEFARTRALLGTKSTPQ